MSSHVFPDGADRASYRGLPSLFQYVNGDGDLCRFNCGQAAACTLLTHLGLMPADPDGDTARGLMTAVEDDHPPDNMGGWFGTSRRRVERICRTHGIEVEDVEGEDALRRALAAGRAVVVMVQTDGQPVWKWRVPGGHWMVAYGYDDRQIFLSNNGGDAGMPWPEFRHRWNGLVPRTVGMRNVGLAAPVVA